MSGWYSLFNILWKITEKSDNKNHARQSLPQGITEENNFEYLPDGNHYHKLDAYYPTENNGSLPVIIDIHGGGWMYADKDLNKIYCEYLASRGFLIFNISYRLVPEVTPREQLQDVCSALKWIQEHISDFPADKNRIMLTGDSAGGMLAAFTGVLSQSEQARNLYGAVDFGLRFNCITLTSPVAYMNEPGIVGAYSKLMWKEKPFKPCARKDMNISDILDLAPSYPPTFLTTSSGDFLALKQTRALYALMQKKGIESELYDLPKYEGKDLPHVYAVLSPMGKPGTICLDKTADFFRRHF